MSDKEKQRFIILKEEDEQKKLLAWYQWLHDDQSKGIKARLKKCATVDEILTQQGFLRLCWALPRHETYLLQGLAIVAGVLSRVEESSHKTLADHLGQQKETTGKPVFSELRFQRLLASDHEDAYLQAMCRAVIQVGKQANPLQLADSILHWQQQHLQPDWFKGSRQWQYHMAKIYYQQVFKYSKEKA